MTSTAAAIDASPGRRLASLGALIVLTFAVGFVLRLPLPTTARGWIPVLAATVVGLLLWAYVLPRIVRPLPARLGLLALVAAASGWFLLEPLFADDRVDEALPMTAADASGEDDAGDDVAQPADRVTDGAGAGDPSESPGTAGSSGNDGGQPAPASEDAAEPAAMPERVAGGTLAGINHRAAGQVGLYTLLDGTSLVRIEEADMENGPDLWVYLVPEPDQDHDGGAVSLGRLKGNVGSSNYPVPADIDVGDFATVLIWCRAFSTPFANATLSPG